MCQIVSFRNNNYNADDNNEYETPNNAISFLSQRTNSQDFNSFSTNTTNDSNGSINVSTIATVHNATDGQEVENNEYDEVNNSQANLFNPYDSVHNSAEHIYHDIVDYENLGYD